MNFNNEAIKSPNNSIPLNNEALPKRMAAYCRVSTNDDILLNSLENQISYFLHVGNNNQNWNLVGLYVDRGKSGTTQKHRRGFQRLIRHCEEGKIDIILTKSISRFSRNTADLLTILRKLRSLNIEVIFEKEGIKTSELDTDFILTVYGAFAERESLNIARNLEWSYRKQFEMGIPNFKRILGYKVTKTKDSIEIAIIPEEAEIVKEIYAKFIDGVTIAQIAKSLNERRVPTIKGILSWQRGHITYTLKNARYLGDTISYPQSSSVVSELTGSSNVREPRSIPNTHPPIIDNDTFMAAKAIFASRKNAKSKPQIFPLSKRIKCGTCGSTYSLVSRYKENLKWTCSFKLKDNSLCNSESLIEDKIKKIFAQSLLTRFGQPTKLKLNKIKSIVTSVDKIDNIENQRIEYYNRLQKAKNGYTSLDNATKQTLIEKIEDEFLLFEKISAEIEDDQIYRKEFLENFNIIYKTFNSWDDFSLPSFRAMIRDIVVFNQSTFQINWCDARVTTIGDCPLIWPVNPVEKKVHYPKDKSTGKKNIISKKDHQSLILTNPEITFDNNLLLNNTSAKLKVAAYCRVSTLDEEHTHSLGIQIAYYVNLILQNPKWNFAGVFIDEGISGTKIDNRPEFKKMIKYAKEDKIDLIITKSVSRFARNTIDCLTTVRDLKSLEKPTGVWFENENIYTLSQTGELTLSLYSSLAQEEAISIGANIRFSRIKNIESGNYAHSGKPPYGYSIDCNNTWNIIPSEKEVVIKIYTMYQNNKTLIQIIEYLANSKIPTPRGGSNWHVGYLRKLLSNPIYRGQVVYQKNFVKDTLTQEVLPNNGELPKYLIENHHEPIVDISLWEDVQSRIIASSTGPRNSKYSKDPFRNLLFCSECNRKVARISSKGKYKYIRCVSSKIQNTYEDILNNKQCNARSYRLETIEHSFMVLLNNLKLDTDWLEEAERKILENPFSKDLINKQYKLEQSLNNCYSNLHKKIDVLDRLDVPERINLAELVDEILSLKKSLRYYDDLLDEWENKKDFFYWFLDQIDNLLIYDYKKYRITFREDIFKKIVKKAILSPNNKITYHFIFGSTLIDDNLDTTAYNLELIF